MAGQWKVKTKEVSDVESSGYLTIRFDVKFGSNVIFPDIIISTTPENYKSDVKKKATELMSLYLVKQTIPQSETIDLD